MAGDPEQSKGDTPSPLPTESTSTLTREGSLTPQWLQPKSSSGGGALRSRLGGDSDRQPDSARRGRTESLGGNEALMPKSRDSERPRAPKWVPDDRETWKPKERWASGPDSSKRWLDVQTTGRQKQGWATGDTLARSPGRWNTEGGRWTEERRHGDDKEYVPKNARWNDEERAERWRATGGRGETASRGRGQHLRGQGVSRRTSSDVHMMPELNGLHSPDFGSKRMDVSNGRRHRYTKKQLLEVYDELQQKMGPVLTLPRGVDVSYQHLFRADRQVAAEEETPVKPKDASPKQRQPSVEADTDGIGPEELEADSWVYKDPVGQVQGPFSRQEVLAWWEEGYFPEDLPVQSQLSAKENWVPLKKLLGLWNVPIASQGTEEVTPAASQPALKLEGCDSLATVGSHISTSLLGDVSTEVTEDVQISQPPAAVSPVLQSPPPQAQQPAAFQNPVSDLQQTMQNLLLQRQKQTQQAAGIGGLNFANTSPGMSGMSGMSGLRQGVPFQPNNPYLGGYGMQQPRPTGLQDNPLLTPDILEALQQRLGAQQPNLNRSQMPSSYGYDPNPGLNNPLQSQMQGNVNLAALLSQNQMAQRNDQRSAMTSDLQRLLQARMQALGNAYGGFNNPAATGTFGNMRGAPYMPQTTHQNPWGNQTAGGYNALNSLLQQRAQPQVNQQQQQLAQAMLLNRLQGMRFPNQQLGMNRPSLQNRDNLLSLAALQGGDVPTLDGMTQHRQRNSMSPPSAMFQTPADPNFALIGQNATPSSLPQFGYPNQKQPPFPQHILHHFGSRPETNASLASESGQESSPPMLSLDTTPITAANAEERLRTSPSADQPAKANAWGVAPSSTAASLLEIQEEETKTAQQIAVAKERQVQAPTTGLVPGSGWNVQPVKPTSLVDIMQEDAESKRQAQAAVQPRQPPSQQPSAKQGAVWSKKGSGQGNTQGSPNEDSGRGNTLTSNEVSVKEEQSEEGGFWNLEASGPTGDSLDLDFSHDVVESEVHLFSGQLKISQQFREWCKANMIELGGSGDIALIEFLLSLKSRSEIAEYIQEYFKEAPSDKLSVFISEFLKRKDGDSVQIKKERGSQKSSRRKTSKNKVSTKSSSNTVELETVSSGASESHGLEAMGSGKTTMRTREVKSKPKAKKQAKGQHIPADMLGFKSNVNFDSLYRGNSNG